jgi:hypothetical protein
MPAAIGNKPTNWELIVNWMTGTGEAENCITTGGWIQGGSAARIERMEAVTCDSARSMLTSGWKYIRVMVTPCSVALSMSRIPLGPLLRTNYIYVVTRFSISGVSRPVYVHTIDMTRISGRMSFGMTI